MRLQMNQVIWSRWHWPWFNRTLNEYGLYRRYEYWFGIGPFQFRYRGKLEIGL